MSGCVNEESFIAEKGPYKKPFYYFSKFGISQNWGSANRHTGSTESPDIVIN